jgi:rubrerythrin
MKNINNLDETDLTIINDKRNIIYIAFLNAKGKTKELLRRQKIFLSNQKQLDKFSGKTDVNSRKVIQKYTRINKRLIDEIYKIRACAESEKETLEEYPPFVAYEIKHKERIDEIIDCLNDLYNKENAIRVDTEDGMEQAIDSLLKVDEEMAIDIFLSRIELKSREEIKAILEGTAECIGFNLVSREKVAQS